MAIIKTDILTSTSKRYAGALWFDYLFVCLFVFLLWLFACPSVCLFVCHLLIIFRCKRSRTWHEQICTYSGGWYCALMLMRPHIWIRKHTHAWLRNLAGKTGHKDKYKANLSSQLWVLFVVVLISISPISCTDGAWLNASTIPPLPSP